MTVKDLIAQLQKCPPNEDVYLDDEGYAEVIGVNRGTDFIADEEERPPTPTCVLLALNKEF